MSVFVIADAVELSICQNYRYRLQRRLADTGLVYAFFGINPSTADALVNDSTVRRWIGFSKAWGASGFIVGNAFAYRATDVKELAACEYPKGEANESSIDSIILDADVLVPCWGNRNKVPKPLHSQFDQLRQRLLASGKPIFVFGFTSSGDPKHPLRLAYSTKLQVINAL